MNEAMEKMRQTGRTTRMLEDALRLADEGKEVYVVFLSNSFIKLHSNTELGRACSAAGVAFIKTNNTALNWRTHNDPDTIVLVDHDVIQHEYAGILKLLHKYDK